MKEGRKGVSIFGRFFSNVELFWNGLAFLLIGIVYDVLTIGSRLPTKWKEETTSINNIENGWVIQAFLFIMYYYLFEKRFFGDNTDEVINRHGYLKYFILKFLLVIVLIFTNAILKSIALILFF